MPVRARRQDYASLVEGDMSRMSGETVTTLDDFGAEVRAFAALAGRTGCRQLDIGYVHDDPPHDWYVKLTYNGDRLIVEGYDRPDEAIDAMAQRILDGGFCTHCGGRTVTAATAEAAIPISLGGRPANADRLTRAQRRRLGRSKAPCVWRREGDKWIRGCEEKL